MSEHFREELANIRAEAAPNSRCQDETGCAARQGSALGMGGRTALTVWSAHLLLSPFYFFDSGLPQPADFLILLLLVVLAIWRQLRMSYSLLHMLVRVGLFVLYASLVNAAWVVALHGELDLLKYPAFYLFNGFVCWSVACMYSWLGHRFVRWTLAVLVFSLAVQVGVVALFGSRHAARGTGFFNNPNQLGYYVVLATSLVWLIEESVRIPRSFRFVLPAFYMAAIYLVVVSMSRAGIVATGTVIVAQMFRRKAVVVVTVGTLALLLWAGMGTQLGEATMEHTEFRTRSLKDELEHRGYDRIWKNPQFLIFGAGEGKFDRFGTPMQGELHSTPGTLLFSYGIVGAVLFLGVFFIIGRHCGWRSLIYTLPAFSYSITHLGMRQSEFWTLLVLIFSLCQRGCRPRAWPVETQP